MHKIEKRGEPEHFVKWKTDFERSYGRKPVYDDLVKSGEYIELKRDLVIEQGYVCCYCEKRIGGHSSLTDYTESFLGLCWSVVTNTGLFHSLGLFKTTASYKKSNPLFR